MPTRSKRHYRRTRRAGVHVSTGFRSKASTRPERGGFLPLYVTVCLENTAIRRSASAMNHCAPRTLSAEP